MTDGYAIVGRVRKPHGIHGELVVETMCDAPDAIFAPGRLVFPGDREGELPAGTPSPIEVRRSRPFKEGLLVMLAGIADRNDAELWRGRYLLLPMSELEPPRDGEVWLHELVGMHVSDVSGAPVGDICEVQRVPQGLLIDVMTARGPVSIPFVDAIVVRVDREARTITIDPPAGLMEL